MARGWAEVMAVVAMLGLPAAARGQAPNASALYAKHCKACHGVRGTPTKDMRGVFKALPDLADRKFYEKRSQDSLVAVILKGRAPNMPAFKGKLTSEESAAVAEYMRTFAGAAKN